MSTHLAPWQRTLDGAGLLRPDGSADVTIFAEMTGLARELDVPNLGQGFPDDQPPEAMLDAVNQALHGGLNQYPPGRGLPVLREAVAAHQLHHHGIELDPARNILVTAGATEALAATLLALVEPGDEVLTVEPFYDAYGAVIALAGGVHTTVPLRVQHGPEGDRFALDPDELRSAVTDRTCLVLVNNPNNPTGFQWSAELLQVLLEAAAAHDALVVTDEVYEHLCFRAPHVPAASLPGGFERTLTISSGGKTFSATGWKIGWVSGPAELIARVEAVKQWLTYTNGAPFQPAVALGLGFDDDFFTARRDDLRARRDLLVGMLRGAGFDVLVPDAGYFTIADLSPLGLPPGTEGVRELARRAGVVGIPWTAFCHPGGEAATLGARWVRFAQCKSVEVLRAAERNLREFATPA